MSLTWELACPHPRSWKRGGQGGRPPPATQKLMSEKPSLRAGARKHTEMSQLAVNRPLTSPPRQRRLNADVSTLAAHGDLQQRNKSNQHNNIGRLLTPAIL